MLNFNDSILHIILMEAMMKMGAVSATSILVISVAFSQCLSLFLSADGTKVLNYWSSLVQASRQPAEPSQSSSSELLLSLMSLTWSFIFLYYLCLHFSPSQPLSSVLNRYCLEPEWGCLCATVFWFLLACSRQIIQGFEIRMWFTCAMHNQDTM